MGLIRILVVGNYPGDQQQSMIRFAQLLVSFYAPYANVRLLSPPVLVGRLPGLPSIVRKYLAYIDKLLLFPLFLIFCARSYDLIHIADHGNSFYSFCLPSNKCIITCHDLLAVRAARGDASLACKTSLIGFLLQKLIVTGLRRANSLVFISKATYNDFLGHIGISQRQRLSVILNSLNAPFTCNISSLHLADEEKTLIPPKPFLLMVGSSHPRKNRRLALHLLLRMGYDSPYIVVFAGAPMSSEDSTFVLDHGLAHRIRSIVRPSHSLLNTLYGLSHALLFPSFSEGFGWPLIEAQACGCPVIASSTTSIPEVAGDAALYADPLDVESYSNHVSSLENPHLRARLIERGYLNIRRFDPTVIGSAYVDFALQSIAHQDIP
jgi:glycosyltransferase involved in cell wall biosynthesis